MVKEQMQMVKMVAGNVSLLHYQLDYGILHVPYVYRMRICCLPNTRVSQKCKIAAIFFRPPKKIASI